MSFQAAEASDPSLTGLALLLRAALIEPGYARNQNQVFDNLDSDPLVGITSGADHQASRVELLAAVAPHQPDEVRIKAETLRFSRDHCQEGPLFPNSRTTTFGRVCRFDALVNSVANSNSTADLGDARALLRDATQAAVTANRLARQKADLTDRPLSFRQMWSFPVADPVHPFSELGVTRSDSLNILGLGCFMPTEELVRFAYRLPVGIDAHQPTAWDSDCFPCWRPGGFTFRLDRDEQGLQEVVHNPITGNNIVASIDPLL